MLNGLNLEVRTGEFLSIVGASGSGSRWLNESTCVGPLSLMSRPVVWKEKPPSKRGAVSQWYA